MKINLQTTIKQLPQKTITGVNAVGEYTHRICNSANNKIADTPFLGFCKEQNINKDTALGAIVLLSSSILAIKSIFSMRDKVKKMIKG